MNDVDTGALGPSGRFARMEAALDRIELKLDLKADASRVAELELKHAALDESIRRMVSGETMSPMGQLYLKRFTDMESAIAHLEDKELGAVAVLQAAKGTADARYSRLQWLVGIAMLLNVCLSVAAFTMAVT